VALSVRIKDDPGPIRREFERKERRKEMSGATKEIGAPENRIVGSIGTCPDAPDDYDLNSGTWTRRHRSQVVSASTCRKSNASVKLTTASGLLPAATFNVQLEERMVISHRRRQTSLYIEIPQTPQQRGKMTSTTASGLLPAGTGHYVQLSTIWRRIGNGISVSRARP
jgi:hypothetical protein